MSDCHFTVSLMPLRTVPDPIFGDVMRCICITGLSSVTREIENVGVTSILSDMQSECRRESQAQAMNHHYFCIVECLLNTQISSSSKASLCPFNQSKDTSYSYTLVPNYATAGTN